MKIRKLKPKDIPACVQLVRANYDDEYAKAAKRELKAAFRNIPDAPQYYVAEENTCVVGFAGVAVSCMDYDIFGIFWVNVAEAFRRRGIGRQLVGRCIRRAKKYGAHLVLLSARADIARWYQRFGFTYLMEKPRCSEVIMSLKVGEA